ncbi:MAG: hypothetical protein MK080_13325 [Opitutales bacterium]|nr:hypothetical protein [Opitutales bacterium]
MPEIEKKDDEAHLETPESSQQPEQPIAAEESNPVGESTVAEEPLQSPADTTPEASEEVSEYIEKTELPEPEIETETVAEAAPESVAETPVSRPRRGRRGRGFSGVKAAAQTEETSAAALSEVTVEAGIRDALSERVSKIKASGKVEMDSAREHTRGESGDEERKPRRPRRPRERRNSDRSEKPERKESSRFEDADGKKDRPIKDKFVKRRPEQRTDNAKGRRPRNTPVKMDFTSEPEKPSLVTRMKGMFSGIFGGSENAAKEEPKSRPNRRDGRGEGSPKRGPRGGRPSGRNSGDRSPRGKGNGSAQGRSNGRRRPRGSGNRRPRNSGATASKESKES